jgi:putative phosphoesterase
MKLALLADIHANARALAAVLSAARAEGVDTLLVAGDFVGYYYEPAQVLAQLGEWNVVAVKGNHEDMLERAATDEAFLRDCARRYGSGLELALASLSGPQREDLIALPRSRRVEIGGVRILLAHGSPWSTDEYLYPDAAEGKWRDVAGLDADVVVCGHTHYRLAKRIGPTLFVNPGSVGQQRDRVPGAAWALLDTAGPSAELRAQPYDADELAAEAGRRDPGLPYLREVLYRK